MAGTADVRFIRRFYRGSEIHGGDFGDGYPSSWPRRSSARPCCCAAGGRRWRCRRGSEIRGHDYSEGLSFIVAAPLVCAAVLLRCRRAPLALSPRI
jgi:hypothetical protein